MKVVILAGGLGTRLSEETNLVPKPMVEIGGRPILWHIMKIYSFFGFNEFIILTGYKSHIIKIILLITKPIILISRLICRITLSSCMKIGSNLGKLLYSILGKTL